MIEKENVLKVAHLANLEIEESELDKYTKQLSDILTEIDKITNVEINEKEILIAPTEEIKINDFNSTITDISLNKEDIFKNANNHDRNYIIVNRVVE